MLSGALVEPWSPASCGVPRQEKGIWLYVPFITARGGCVTAMNIHSVSEPEPPLRRWIEVALWLWIGGITAAYLYQFFFVLPLIFRLFD